MALQPVKIVLEDEEIGAAIVDTTTNIPIPMSRIALSYEEAFEFVDWAGRTLCWAKPNDIVDMIEAWRESKK